MLTEEDVDLFNDENMSQYTNQEFMSAFKNVASTISRKLETFDETFSPPEIFSEKRQQKSRLHQEPMIITEEVKLS